MGIDSLDCNEKILHKTSIFGTFYHTNKPFKKTQKKKNMPSVFLRYMAVFVVKLKCNALKSNSHYALGLNILVYLFEKDK